MLCIFPVSTVDNVRDVVLPRADDVTDCFSENMDWWIARHLVTNTQGYIPSNYVVKDDNNPESQE